MKTAFLKGMDISFLDEIETEGGAFYENGKEKDMFDIMKDNGVNSIRLRIWNEPPHGYCNLERTKMLAKRIKARGLHFLLDFHYSDIWADPGKQFKPKAWEQLSFPELADAVKGYTKQVMAELKEQGTLPDMVQIGNEITNGMLWNEGKVSEEFDTDAQWRNFADLIQAGIQGVKEVLDDSDQVAIMIHIDRGGDNKSSRYFFDRLAQLGVDYDIIGQSYYPWWHGTLEQLTDNLNDLAKRYKKEIVVAETAYPWTLTPPDDKGLICGTDEQVYTGYPATVEGQTNFLDKVMRIIKETPDELGIGVYYWEPCWIPSKPEWSVGHSNSWGNLCLFDYQGNKLASLDIFKKH
jgi:arabinogalactan endo-1,4-beta-galactosidase